MKSIYEHALGSDFQRLHPRIQERFGFGSGDGVASIGTGVMSEIWHGALYTLPFLYVGAWRRIMFPERGRNVPFTIENYAFVDPLGRETVTWIRKFKTGRARRFDAYMIYSEKRGRIVDYLGTHQHLAVDLDLRVDERGGSGSGLGRSAFTRVDLLSRFHCYFPALPMYATGTTIILRNSASMSMSTTVCGGRSLATADRLMLSGRKSGRTRSLVI